MKDQSNSSIFKERILLNNLPSNTDSHFYFTQISLEGILKFLGQWSNETIEQLQLLQQQNQAKQQRTNLSLAESLTNLMSGGAQPQPAAVTATSSGGALFDDISNKIINQVAELLSDDTRTSSSTSFDLNTSSFDSTTATAAVATQSFSCSIQRSFNRNNLDITSVLRTVLDYNESFFKNPCLQLKLDILRSMLYLANSLYDSRQQFEALAAKLQHNFEWLNAFVQQDIDNIGVS